MKILKLEDNIKVNYIFHFADIHIRLNSRIEEYRYIFQKVYSKLKEYKANGITNALICIAGDILHSKVDLSPECILETFNFFKNLSGIYDTMIVGGNHDTLLTNKSRVDSLTSILYERPLENFYFLKDTGVYRYNNLVFFIDSLFDDIQIDMTKTNPMINKIKEEDNCIPLTIYHGSIPGWKNVKGFVSKEGDKYISEMDGMALCLLGDIHLYQIMHKENPTALYSSSLISQNFGETDVNHGFVMHHLKYSDDDSISGRLSLSHEYIRIKNKYRFQDVYVSQGGQAIITDEQEYYLFKKDNNDDDDGFRKKGVIAEKGNIRVFSEENNEIESRRVFEFLKKKFPQARWVFNTNLMEKNNHSMSSTTMMTDTDAIDPAKSSSDYSVIDVYFEQIKDKFVSEREMKEAYKYVVRSYQEHFYSRNNNIQWRLLLLEFSNLFSYGKNNKIDFRNLDRNTVGIFGPNAYGKSTIIDIITSILYDKITRMSNSSIAKELIHVNETKASAKLLLSIGNSVYEINKTYSRGAKSGKITIKTTLFEVDQSDGRRHELTDEQRLKTNKHIEKIIGSYETFCFFNLYLQQRESSFREMSNSKRKSFLYELYGYAFFEGLEKKHKDCYKDLEIENKVYETKHRALSEWDYDREESKLKEKYEQEKEKFDRDKNEIALLDSQIASLNRSLINFTHENEDNDDDDTHRSNNILTRIKKKEDELHTLEKSLAIWSDTMDEKLYQNVLAINNGVTTEVFSNNKSIQRQQLQEHERKIKEINDRSVEEIDSQLQRLQRNIVDKLDCFDASIISNFPQNQLKSIQSNVNDLRHKIPDLQNFLKKKYMKLSQDIANITPNAFQTVKNTMIRQKNECRKTLKELNLKRKTFKEFQSTKESIQSLLPLYQKYASNMDDEHIFHKYKPNGSVMVASSNKEEWEIYYQQIKCNTETENSLSKDALLIEEIDSKLSNLQERMLPLRSTSTTDIKPSKYSQYCSDIKEYESSRSIQTEEDMNLLLTNDSLLTIIEKFKDVTSTLEAQQDNRTHLIDTIENCSRGFSINKNCNECLNNPYNQQRLKLEKKLVRLEKEISSTENLYQGYLSKIQGILRPKHYTITCIKDIQELIQKAKHTQKLMNDIQHKKGKVQEYENHKEYKILYKTFSALKQQRADVVNHQKKMSFYLQNLEVFNLLNKLWSLNTGVDMVISFLESFDEMESNSKDIQIEIDRTEETLEQLTQKLRDDIIPTWEEDLKLKKEIESIEQDLSFFSDASRWLEEMKKKEKYEENVGYEQEIRKFTSMKDVLVFDTKYKPLIVCLDRLMKIPTYRNAPDTVTIHTVYDNIVKYKNEIERLQIEIKQLKKNHTDLEYNDSILQKLDDLNKSKSRVQLQIECHSNEMTSISMSLAELHLKQSDFKDVVDTLKKNKQKLNLEKIYISIFDKDGLPLFLLQKKIGKVEDKINQMLSPFLGQDKQVRFGLSSDYAKTIEYGFSNKNTTMVSSFVSGAESFLLDIVTKFSLSYYSVRPRSNFFFCDEGLSVLDKTKLSEVDLIFEFFRSTQTNFFIISHITQIRDHVEKVLIVSKDTNNKKSFIDFK